MSLPVGTILPFLGLNIPPGYLLLNGQLITREQQYDELFHVLGFSNALQINLPDLRGRFLMMQNNTTIPLQSIGGEAQIRLTEGQLPPHSHSGFAGTDGHRCHSAAVNSGCNSHPHGTGPIGITGRGDPITILPPFER